MRLRALEEKIRKLETLDIHHAQQITVLQSKYDKLYEAFVKMLNVMDLK